MENKSRFPSALRCSAGVLGVCCAIAFAFALALDFALHAGVGSAVLATSTSALSVGPFPTLVPFSPDSKSTAPTIAANPSQLLWIFAAAAALMVLRSFCDKEPPHVAQKRTLSGSSGASGSGCGVCFEMIESILVLRLNE